jgi:hypothetical protein
MEPLVKKAALVSSSPGWSDVERVVIGWSA